MGINIRYDVYIERISNNDVGSKSASLRRRITLYDIRLCLIAALFSTYAHNSDICTKHSNCPNPQ